MKFAYKKFKLKKIKSHLKKNKLLFISSEIQYNSKNKNLNCYNIQNKAFYKILWASLYKAIKLSINCVILFLNEKSNWVQKKRLVINFKTQSFLAIKINNKIYKFSELKKTQTLNYFNIKLTIFKFTLACLKKIEIMWFEHMTSCSQSRRASNCATFRCSFKKF